MEGTKRKSLLLRKKMNFKGKLMVQKQQDEMILDLQRQYEQEEEETKLKKQLTEQEFEIFQRQKRNKKPTFILTVSSVNKRSDLTPYNFENSQYSKYMADSDCFVQSLKNTDSIDSPVKTSTFNRKIRPPPLNYSKQAPYSPSQFARNLKKDKVDERRDSTFSPSKGNLGTQEINIKTATYLKRLTLDNKEISSQVKSLMKSPIKTRGKSEYFTNFSLNVNQGIQMLGDREKELSNKMMPLTEENSIQTSSSKSSSSSSNSSSSSIKYPKKLKSSFSMNKISFSNSRPEIIMNKTKDIGSKIENLDNLNSPNIRTTKTLISSLNNIHHDISQPRLKTSIESLKNLKIN